MILNSPLTRRSTVPSRFFSLRLIRLRDAASGSLTSSCRNPPTVDGVACTGRAGLAASLGVGGAAPVYCALHRQLCCLNVCFLLAATPDWYILPCASMLPTLALKYVVKPTPNGSAVTIASAMPWIVKYVLPARGANLDASAPPPPPPLMPGPGAPFALFFLSPLAAFADVATSTADAADAEATPRTQMLQHGSYELAAGVKLQRHASARTRGW